MSNIEDDVKIVKRYLENSSYKESDSDFFKNGGWEMVDLEIPKSMANILSEREQDKARIKELESKLEEANKQLDLDYVDENYIPKQKAKEMQAKIKELEEKNDRLKYKLLDTMKGGKIIEEETPQYIKENYIPTQKVKDILNEIQEEYNKLEEQFDCIWDKKSKDNYDRYKLQELSAMQQELGFILGKFEKLLGEENR